MNRGALLLAFSFVVASLSVGACSTREANGVGGSCANYASALRDASKQCGGGKSLSPSRETDYFARFEQVCQNALNAPGSGLTGSVLDQCAAKIRETCDDDACEDLVDATRGTLADGTACDADYQCASGQCKTGGNSQTPSCGKCAPAAAIGEPCPEGGCVPGASCRTTSTGTSSTSVCVATRTAQQGEACGSTSGTGESVRCAAGLNCRYQVSTNGSPTNGTCQPPLAEGEACGTAESGYAQCKPPLGCVNGRCGARLAAGATCEDSGDCEAGLGCDPATKQCAAITWGAAGAVCDDDLRRCDRGFCSRTGSTTDGTGTCVDYLTDGSPCELKNEEQRCDSLSRCINGTCQLENPAQCQ